MQKKAQENDRQRIQEYLLNEHPEMDTPRTERAKQFLALEPQELYDRKQMIGHVTASLLVLSPDEQKVLVIEHQHLKATLHPGGHIDAPDDSYSTALKECEEETGLKSEYIKPWLRWPMHVVFDIDSHRVPENTKKNEGEHLHHDLTYIAKSTTWDLPPTVDAGVRNPHWMDLHAFEHTSRRAKALYTKIMDVKTVL